MVWFFTRGSEQVTYGIRQDEAGVDYELFVTYPDGQQRVERTAAPAELIDRFLGLQQALMREGWAFAGIRQDPAWSWDLSRSEPRTPATDQGK